MDADVFSAFCKEAAKIPREVRGNKVSRKGSKPIGIAKLLAKEKAMSKEAESPFAKHVQAVLAQSEGSNEPPDPEVKEQLEMKPKREDSRDNTTTLPGAGATSAMIERT